MTQSSSRDSPLIQGVSISLRGAKGFRVRNLFTTVSFSIGKSQGTFSKNIARLFVENIYAITVSFCRQQWSYFARHTVKRVYRVLINCNNHVNPFRDRNSEDCDTGVERWLPQESSHLIFMAEIFGLYTDLLFYKFNKQHRISALCDFYFGLLHKTRQFIKYYATRDKSSCSFC